MEMEMKMEMKVETETKMKRDEDEDRDGDQMKMQTEIAQKRRLQKRGRTTRLIIRIAFVIDLCIFIFLNP